MNNVITSEVINNLITDEIKRYRHSPKGFLPFKNRELLEAVIGLRGVPTIGNAGSNEKGYYTDNVTVRMNDNILQIYSIGWHIVTLSNGDEIMYKDMNEAIEAFKNAIQ